MTTNPNDVLNFIAQLGWVSKPSGTSNAAIKTCPFCEHSNFKFFICIEGDHAGLWDCKVCGEKGNFFQLRERLGYRTTGLVSVHDVAAAKVAPAKLPDFNALSWRLWNDEGMADVQDYLVFTRKLSIDTLKQYRVGAEEYDGKKWLVIPYFNIEDVPVFYKARSLPKEGEKRTFRSPAGREAPLFNEAVIVPGMEELLVVEGEIDALSVLSQGYSSVVGVPGAGVKKAAWIDKIDRCAPKAIYLLYDRDKVGQEAAREMAVRIGIDKVKNICLPEFDGKDINDWLSSGKTLDDLKTLMAEAQPFNVQGVQSLPDVLDELKRELEEKGTEPTYKSPWPSLDKRLGGCEPGDVVGIMAEAKSGKTTLALNWLHYYAFNGIPSLMFCLEMPPKRMVRKWVSHVTQTDDTPGSSQLTPEVINTALQIGLNMPGDLLFGYAKVAKASEVFDTIRQAVRRYGVKVVCFDNLQLLVRSVEHFAQETSRLTKDFKSLAMELGIVVLLIVQPHRVPEGTVVSARNAHGSAAIEKDVDSMICLHRNRVAKLKQSDLNGFIDTEENFEPQMFTRVDLSRYAPGGLTTLYMDGARSTVTEFEIGVAASKITDPQKEELVQEV